MFDPASLATGYLYLKYGTTIVSFLGIVFGVFRVISWVKNKFIAINDNVLDLKTSLETNFTGLRDDVKEQTKVIASALSEQRQDFRTFYAPTLLMLQQSQVQQNLQPSPARAKRATRKPAKRK
jgi:hypothetical protein